MKKVVLLAINAKYVHSSLSVWVIADGIKKYARLPYDVSVIEATIHQQGSDIADMVAASAPDVIGVSTYIWNAGMMPEILSLLRERLPDVVIVLGGPEASHNADFWLERGADHVLPGEGEHTFPAFLDGCHGDSSINANGQENRPLDSLDNMDDYIDALDGRIAYLETSRGCPFQCAFCLSSGSGVRFFPIETAKKWLQQLSKSNARTIKLVDRTFNCDAGRAYELFEYVINLDTACCFHFEVAADLFDERTLELLSTAPPGRIQLEAGLQSFFEPALKAASRKTDLRKAEQNIRTLLRGQNIHTHVDLIAGLPFEELHDFQDGFDRAYSLGAHTLQLGFLKLLHGSELRRQAESLGILFDEEAPYEIRSSKWLSPEDIQVLKHTENALQHTYNKSRFLSTVEYVLSVSGLRPSYFYRELGKAAPNHGTYLEVYAVQVHDFCIRQPGVSKNELHDRMVCDWLSMVKGKNMPDFMRNRDSRQGKLLETAANRLGHKMRREEATILSSGRGVFVDSENRDPVTGLYRVHQITK